MNHQPPDAPDHGHCLRCKRFVIEEEQKSGICIDCQDGGPAFPVAGSEHGYPVAGMSMRDYFAAKCDVAVYTPFNNLNASLGRRPTVGELAEYIAGIRFIEADAMLAARGESK